MTDSIAVLSDIHGVLPALRAVLDEPDVRAADRLVVTGDIAAGPQPREVLDLLEGLGERVVWVRGNADRELVEFRRGPRAGVDPGDPVSPWAARQLDDAHLDRLQALPTSVTLGDVLFCHATPRDDEEVVLVDSSLDRWSEVLDGVPPAVRTIVCGHSHMPFVRLAHGRLVVNPGSVGMPYGRTGAHWALLGRGVELRVTGYDVEAAIAEIADITDGSSYPDAAEWADYFLNARASDTEALTTFAPRDGR
ncbi:metallophosphoesterase family protein [Streptomyces montanisoli]|uniref:Metallophosphoesterase family protein n=1 Tax=Streptomyces montanisoli TaxID=2798581 RepID=A0A940MG80_9ACTN|nr:metallophosphoesterase family protein [Streptomyces montanisoli]MBP0458058.1 metallophosphoesterase family protein [Streptomyces montanisoli]